MFKRTIIVAAFSLVLLLATTTNCHANTDPADPITIYAGYSRVNINPDLSLGGIPLAGYGNTQYRLATSDGQTYQQDLTATAVAIKDNVGGQHIFVTVDNVGARQTWVDPIIAAITEATAIPPESITISATHTHSAPDTSSTRSTVTGYINNILIPQITNAIKTAIEDATHEAEIYTGSIKVGNTPSEYMNFVRHYRTNSYDSNGRNIISGDNHGGRILDTDGLVKTTKVTGFENQGHVSEADREMQFIRLKMQDADDILMVNWQAHPTITGGGSFTTISADFIASFREKVEQECNCRVAYYTGAAGNLNTSTKINDGSEGIAGLTYSRNTSSDQAKYQTSIAYGTKLAENAIQMYDNLAKAEPGYIYNNQQEVTLNQTKIDSTNEENIPLIRNAYFIRTIYKATNQSVVNMIRGTYNYNLTYGFPDGFDSSGEGIRSFISKYSNLRNAFSVSTNGTVSDSLTAESITRSNIQTLATMIGFSLSPHLDSVYAADSVINRSSANREDTRTIKIFSTSIGDISFTAVPYEMFSTNGEFIKNNTHSKLNFVLEKTNMAESYAPSAEAYDYGCYEADTTKYAKGSAEIVAQELVDSVNSLRQHTVITHHYYNNSTESIAPDETETYEFGEEYETKSVLDSSTYNERYILVSNPEHASGTVNKNLEITYYYVDKNPEETEPGPETNIEETKTETEIINSNNNTNNNNMEVPNTGETTNKNSSRFANTIPYEAIFIIIGVLSYWVFKRLKKHNKIPKF